jgi:hypothetical protein
VPKRRDDLEKGSWYLLRTQKRWLRDRAHQEGVKESEVLRELLATAIPAAEAAAAPTPAAEEGVAG